MQKQGFRNGRNNWNCKPKWWNKQLKICIECCVFLCRFSDVIGLAILEMHDTKYELYYLAYVTGFYICR